MGALFCQDRPNPLLLPEIVALILDNVHMVPDLLNCACINSVWSAAALKRLYAGSLNDMQFRTPDIGSLNCLLVASRARFARNMSFVKDLLIAPETPVKEVATDLDTRLVCVEKYRALRHRQYAELLFLPHGSGPKSLTIPFEMVDQDLSSLSDLLPPPTVEYLAIDNAHCKDLIPQTYRNLGPLHEKFANLKALTIYKSNVDEDETNLFRLLEYSSLRFFHLEEPYWHFDPHQTSAGDILPLLERQWTLEALALYTRGWNLNGNLVSPKQILWPDLKALYLREVNQDWLELLPNLENLQILRLQEITPTQSQIAIEMISKCPDLRIVDLVFQDLGKAAPLIEIARGCPRLQKFKVDCVPLRGAPELLDHQFTELLRALPNVEFLEVCLKFSMDGARLQDIARSCPHLIVLNLPRTRMYLSLLLLSEAFPLANLEVMLLDSVWFEEPRSLLQPDKIHCVVDEWKRIFPKVRVVPCPADRNSVDVFTSDDDMSDDTDDMSDDTDDMSDDSDDDMTDVSDELVEDSDGDTTEDSESHTTEERRSTMITSLHRRLPNDRRFEFNDVGSEWFKFRVALWRSLGYSGGYRINEQFDIMWQTNLEIEIIGWPVVPLKAFSESEPYSTSAHGSC